MLTRFSWSRDKVFTLKETSRVGDIKGDMILEGSSVKRLNKFTKTDVGGLFLSGRKPLPGQHYLESGCVQGLREG